MAKRLFKEKKVDEVFIDEQANMLENDPEIRKPELKTVSRFKLVRAYLMLKKALQNKKAQAGIAAGLIAPMAITLVACQPSEELPDDDNKKDDDDKKDDDKKKDDDDNKQDDELTEADIVKYLDENVKSKLISPFVLGSDAVINNYLAVDFKVENGENNLYLLIDFAKGSNNSAKTFVKITMTCEMTEENIKNGTFKPTSNRASREINFPANSKVNDEATIANLLKKINNIDDITDLDIIAITETDLGTTSEFLETRIVTIYTLDKNGITVTSIHAANPAIDNIINGAENDTYYIHADEGNNYTFSDKALYNFSGLGNEDEEVATNYRSSPGLDIVYGSGNKYTFMINGHLTQMSDAEREE